MSEERRMSISSSSRLSPDEVARHTFATVRRGFDPAEVREFLDSVATELRSWAEREADLRKELAGAQHLAANPVLDEATLTSALGTETARVLRSAHEAAHDMVTKAESEAERMLDRARSEIDEAETKAEAALAERTSQAEAAVAELRRRVQEESAVVLEAARTEAEAMVAQARTECREMVDEAQALRSRVLADLSRRRKILHAQIEQLRAGRERLVETIRGVRRSVDTIAEDLFRAEDQARLAAESAGRDALARPDEGTPEEQAASLLAEEAAAVEHEAVGAGEGDGEGDGAGGWGAGSDVAAEVVAGTEPGTGTEPEAGDEPGTEPEVAGVAFDEPTAAVEVVDGDVVTGAGDAVDAGGSEPAGTDADLEDGRDERDAEGSPPAGDAPVEEPVSDEGEPGPDGGGDDGGAGRLGAAEEAFAKLRAASASVDVGASAGEPAGDGPGGSAAGDGTGDEAGQSDEAGDETGHADEVDREDGSGGGDEAGDEAGEADAVTVRRDELVAPVVVALARRVKRVLQDDQNEILDRLRSHAGVWSEDVLADDVEQRDALVTATLPHLEQAALAGRAFLDPSATGNPDTDTLLAIGGELADSLLVPLRRRLAGAEGLADADESVVVEHVGAAFREWRGERIERLVTDQVIAAFSAGTLASARGPVVWHAVSADGSPCPDCEDNALAGALGAGEEFPTGHLMPPAHPGCRCLIVADVP